MENKKVEKAIVSGCPANLYPNIRVIHLPTDHYDFGGPVDVRGKTEEEILQEVSKIMEKS